MENCRVHVSSISPRSESGGGGGEEGWCATKIKNEKKEERKKKNIPRRKNRQRALDGPTIENQTKIDRQQNIAEREREKDRKRDEDRENACKRTIERYIHREEGKDENVNGRREENLRGGGDAAQVLSGRKKWLFLLECARCTCTFSRRTDGGGGGGSSGRGEKGRFARSTQPSATPAGPNKRTRIHDPWNACVYVGPPRRTCNRASHTRARASSLSYACVCVLPCGKRVCTRAHHGICVYGQESAGKAIPDYRKGERT
ncbi:hypothetical protein WH47_05511 [Habropoda laboriosa]|uniref:Uncharacterized protein n=1 Tax=Habropoda laboriosa TaxID=597456 RepID=A0A0L7RFG2_9HYME|nr:hypothetical protein WH47_05511 [Habropoda laboriosa]